MKTTMMIAVLAFVVLTASAQKDGKKTKETEYETWMQIGVRDHLTHDKIEGLKGELLIQKIYTYRMN